MGIQSSNHPSAHDTSPARGERKRRGADVRYIQEILGHNSIKTTMIYAHVSGKKLNEIKSPLDDLDI